MPRLLTFVLAAVCAAVVAWVHLLPLALDGVQGPADKVARYRMGLRIAQESRGQALGRRDLEARTEEWIRRNPSQFASDRDALVSRYKDALRFTAANGKTYNYLGDEDSYTWIRLARNYLRTGTTCDAVDDGSCRDALVNPPFGITQIYNRSLHIAAIVALQRVLSFFDPQYPLTTTAFWIPVIVATLGAVPAFWIGHRLAGPVGAIGAALLTALHPFVLQRSIGSDNDIWNVVLPMYMNAAAVAALFAGGTRGRVGWAALAGVFAALHALTWSGWVFTYVVLVAALVATAAVQAVGNLLRHRTPARVARGPARAERRRSGAAAPSSSSEPATAPAVGLRADAAVRTPLLVLVTFYLVAGVGVRVVAPDRPYFALPFNLASPLVRMRAIEDGAPTGSEPDVWPNALNTVSELARENFAATQERSFGRNYLIAALWGLLLLLAPAPPWTVARGALLVSGGLLLGVLGTGAVEGSRLVVIGAALPLGVGALMRAAGGDPADRRRLGPMLVVATWFLAGLYASFGAERLVLLLAPGLGLAIGLGAGRLHQVLTAALESALPRFRKAVAVTLGVLVCLLYLPAAQRGYAAARSYLPAMNDAWWDTLTALRERAAPDAIINVWWDYGYWAKYVAERRVTTDGSTLLTHLPYWVGRALVAPTERESMGLLRMLSCGSDATPLPEGERSAFGLIRSKVQDTIRAHQLVIDLANRTREQAASYLAEQGFAAAESEAVLARTHCSPPETYLVIGTDLTAKDSWMRLAAWDFRRSYIAQRAARLPETEVVADITRRFGYGQEEARALYADAKSKPMADFVIGPAPRAPSVWYPCRPTSASGAISCPLGLFDVATKTVVDEFVFNTFAPQDSVLRFRHAEAGQPPSAPVEQAPAALVVAGVDLKEMPVRSPGYAGAAILLDELKWRVMVGPAPLIRSNFTHLLFLDQRHETFFEKVDERTSYKEDRLQTWRVRFPPG